MDVNYILIKGNKHFKCHSLARFLLISLCIYQNLRCATLLLSRKTTIFAAFHRTTFAV